jgi:hypothetical protein
VAIRNVIGSLPFDWLRHNKVFSHNGAIGAHDSLRLPYVSPRQHHHDSSQCCAKKNSFAMLSISDNDGNNIMYVSFLASMNGKKIQTQQNKMMFNLGKVVQPLRIHSYVHCIFFLY